MSTTLTPGDDIRAALEAWCALPDVRRQMIATAPGPRVEPCPRCGHAAHPGGPCLEVEIIAAEEVVLVPDPFRRPDFIEEKNRGWVRL